MFFLDLKRADVAIASGRLDEAFQVLQSSEERKHRDGQKLVDRLTKSLVARATEHLANDRLEDAHHDVQRALQLAGRKPEVTELLKVVSAAQAERQHRQQRRQNVVKSAQQQLQAGDYSLGAKLLNVLSEDHSTSGQATRQRLAEEIDAKKLIVSNTAARVQTLIDAGEFQSAVAALAQLPPEQRAAASIAKLIPAATGPIVENGVAELNAGRLDRVASIVSTIAVVSVGCQRSEELQQNLSRCHAAKRHLEEHRLVEAEREFAALQQMLPDCEWIREAHAAVTESIRQLTVATWGPLGLLPDDVQASTAQTAAISPNVSPKSPITPQPPADTRAASHNILQVDGAGSLLLLNRDTVTIGASTSATAFDVSVMTEGTAVPIFVRRDGDDYFAESAEPFSVNGSDVKRKLLASGDTIAIGARGRLRFVKNVAASNSAVLQVTGAKLARRHVRSVVLMADSLLFGPAGSHFRLPDVAMPIVLHRQNHGYALRQAQTGPEPAAATLNTGESAVMNDTRFALV